MLSSQPVSATKSGPVGCTGLTDFREGSSGGVPCAGGGAVAVNETKTISLEIDEFEDEDDQVGAVADSFVSSCFGS